MNSQALQRLADRAQAGELEEPCGTQPLVVSWNWRSLNVLHSLESLD